MRAELLFPTMGSEAHVLVEQREGDVEHEIAQVHELLQDLERRWSRFLDSSELSTINSSAPLAVPVSRLTFDLIELSLEAWRLTARRFDPCLGAAMVGNGYDRTFDEIGTRQAVVTAVEWVRGAAGVHLDRGRLAVGVPVGAQLDLGGIGKGRAADLAVELLATRGVRTACVNVGGDARVIGGAGLDEGWVIGVEDPFDCDRLRTTLALDEGAVVTSSRTRRRWSTTSGDRHHLLDPATGTPAESGLAQVTVLAAEAAWAEVIAKAAFVAGVDTGPGLVESSGAAALLITDAGDLIRCGGIERFER